MVMSPFNPSMRTGTMVRVGAGETVWPAMGRAPVRDRRIASRVTAFELMFRRLEFIESLLGSCWFARAHASLTQQRRSERPRRTCLVCRPDGGLVRRVAKPHPDCLSKGKAQGAEILDRTRRDL